MMLSRKCPDERIARRMSGTPGQDHRDKRDIPLKGMSLVPVSRLRRTFDPGGRVVGKKAWVPAPQRAFVGIANPMFEKTLFLA
jgi:hypothetical protein